MALEGVLEGALRLEKERGFWIWKTLEVGEGMGKAVKE